MDTLRAIVRPLVQLGLAGVALWATVHLVLKFSDVELARYVIAGIIGAAIALLSSYAGERAGKRKEDK